MPGTRATPAEEYATDAEVEAAVRALSEADHLRLKKIATFRALALVGLGIGMSGDDLMQEAIVRTLVGRKRWRKKVKFVTHLIQSIRNISGHERDAVSGWDVVAIVETEPAARGDGVVPVCRAGDSERQAAAEEQLRLIAKRFEGDDEVGLVVEGLASGMTGPQIQSDLNITKTEFETIMTRLRRGLDRDNGWRP